MDIYGKVVKYCVHPLWMAKDDKLGLFKYLKEFERSQYAIMAELQDNQLTRMKNLLAHAYQHCPFYRMRFDSAGIHPADIKDFSDFTHIPWLTKDDIQANLTGLIADNFSPTDLIPNQTGGSTGKPLHYFHDMERMLSMEASAIRHDRWAGFDIGDKMAVIWGHRRDLSSTLDIKGEIRNRVLTRKRFLDSSSITEEAMREFVLTLRRFKPKTILAYASAAYLFSQYCRAHGITDIMPDSIITSAEVLHDHERSSIEEVFGCKIFNRYGCREVSVIASECSAHAGMHINADALYVEFVKDDGTPAAPGELGNIIITDLYNWGMPFIRYRIEDLGVPESKKCVCGRGLPLMQMVGGRVTDFLITPEGVRVSGASITIYLIANTTGIKQAQFVQEKEDQIILKIVRDHDFSLDSIQFLDRKLPEFFGPRMHITYEYMDDIPREPSGKYRFSICKL